MTKADTFKNEYDRGYMDGYDEGEAEGEAGWGWFEFVVGLCMGAVIVRMLF